MWSGLHAEGTPWTASAHASQQALLIYTEHSLGELLPEPGDARHSKLIGVVTEGLRDSMAGGSQLCPGMVLHRMPWVPHPSVAANMRRCGLSLEDSLPYYINCGSRRKRSRANPLLKRALLCGIAATYGLWKSPRHMRRS